MIGRALTSISWGVVADRYGRKPVIIIGTLSVLVLIKYLVYIIIIIHNLLQKLVLFFKTNQIIQF